MASRAMSGACGFGSEYCRPESAGSPETGCHSRCSNYGAGSCSGSALASAGVGSGAHSCFRALRVLGRLRRSGSCRSDFQNGGTSVATCALFLDGEDQAAFRSGCRLVSRLERKTPQAPPADTLFRPEAAYLITGGFRGLGLEMARWMVATALEGSS